VAPANLGSGGGGPTNAVYSARLISRTALTAGVTHRPLVTAIGRVFFWISAVSAAPVSRDSPYKLPGERRHVLSEGVAPAQCPPTTIGTAASAFEIKRPRFFPPPRQTNAFPVAGALCASCWNAVTSVTTAAFVTRFFFATRPITSAGSYCDQASLLVGWFVTLAAISRKSDV